MKSIRHYAMLCVEYGAISSIMVIRCYKLPTYPGGRLTVAFTFQEVFSFELCCGGSHFLEHGTGG